MEGWMMVKFTTPGLRTIGFLRRRGADARAVFIFEYVTANKLRIPPPLSYQHQENKKEIGLL